jgi:S1-C subfamily serine protease
MRHALIVCLLLPALANAQQTINYKISSGTGFVINNDGHVVTNNHVVRGCKSISVLTPKGEEAATLIANDSTRDLAVLKTSYISQVSAPLRWNINELKVGDSVVVMGFPGQEGAEGHSKYQKTAITALKGPTGEDGVLQLKSVAAKGNSGGPVLDGAGNVIAVISGMALTYRVDASTGNLSHQPIGKSDIAITLDALRDFLRQHGIGFYESASGLVMHGDSYLQENAAHFILPVRCVQDISYQ